MKQPAHPMPEEPPPHLSYRRGLRYREELQATGRPIRCARCRTVLQDAVRLLPLSRIDPDFRIADALAQEYGTDRGQMRQVCYYAAAVDTITLYCGDEARTLILQGHRFLDRKTVLQISRTAPPRQRHALEQVRLGWRPLDTKGKGCPVYDTVDFKEILSRLRRAQGKVGICVLGLDHLAETFPDEKEAAAIKSRLQDLCIDTHQLMQGVQLAPEGKPCPCDLAKRSPKRQQTGHGEPRNLPVTLHRMLGSLNQAHSWMRKCARDLPQLLREVLPLGTEKEEIRRRGWSIIEQAELLLQRLVLA